MLRLFLGISPNLYCNITLSRQRSKYCKMYNLSLTSHVTFVNLLKKFNFNSLALSPVLLVSAAYPRPPVSSPLSLFSSCPAQHLAVLAVFLRSLLDQDPYIYVKASWPQTNILSGNSEFYLCLTCLLLVSLEKSFLLHFSIGNVALLQSKVSVCYLVSSVFLRLCEMHYSRGELSNLKF